MIDTVALKTTIIDLAVSGKVSSQFHPSDSVSNIIDALPDVSSKRKKLLGQSYEYGLQNTIPAHWMWIRLGEIASYGDSPTKASYDDVSNDTWILDLEDIKSGGEIITKTRVHEKKFIGEKNVFIEGQVLYSKLRPYLKKVLVADEDGISTPELVSFSIFGGVLPQYIVYCLLSSFTNRAIDKRSYGIKMPRVDAGFMVNLPIPLPPVSEQHFIVDQVQAAFSRIDTIDELQTEYADNLTALKSKLIDAAIQGKLTEQLTEDGTAEELYQQIQTEKNRLSQIGKTYREKGIKVISDNDIPYDIPDTWCWVRLGDLTTVITKGSSPSWQGVSYTSKEEGILFVTSENVGNGKMILSKKKYIEPKFNDMHPASILIKGDILTNLVGASIGRTAVYNEDTDNANINQAVCIIRLVEREITNYLLLYLGSTTAIDKMLHGSVDFARANLSLTSVSNLMIPLPPLAEQKRIVQKLEEILPLCERIN